MSKILFVCSRDESSLPSPRLVETLAHTLTPHGDPLKVDFASTDPHAMAAVFSPSQGVAIGENNRCIGVGNIEGDASRWGRVGASKPEGAYAIVRYDEDSVELVSDCLASRTLWYVLTPTLFVASTSQRAILSVLGDFQFNHEVVSWVLSAGILGPGYSWDKRIKSVGPSTIARLSRRDWSVSVTTEPIGRETGMNSYRTCRAKLKEAIEETYNRLDIDLDHWVLSLSGGYDSRCSFAQLKKKGLVRCITWGHPQSINDSGSDAQVAKSLADRYGQRHEYFPIESSGIAASEVLDRFVRHHEGRIDHINGAADGYERYRSLQAAGVQGLVRTDVGFSTQCIVLPGDLYRQLDITMVDDFPNLRELVDGQVAQQVLPDSLAQQSGESLPDWRDRVYQEFRIPYIQAALADARLFYMEQANPMLTRRIIRVLRSLPPRCREDKKIFKSIVDEMIPGIPIARASSLRSTESLLASDEARSAMLSTLEQDTPLIPNQLHLEILRRLRQPQKPTVPDSPSFRVEHGQFKQMFELLPSGLKHIFRVARALKIRSQQPSLDFSILTFRCYTILRMNEILQQDALLAQTLNSEVKP